MSADEIRCSEGVFTKEEFLAYLNIGNASFERYIRKGKKDGQSEEEIIEDLVFCNKIKKNFNLGQLPIKEKIVKYHDTYYPSVSCWVKMNNLSKSKRMVLDLFAKGFTLDEIESILVNDIKKKQNKQERNENEKEVRPRIQSKDDKYAFYKSKEDDKVKIIKKSGNLLINVVGGKSYTSVVDLAKDYGMSAGSVNYRLKKCHSFSQAIGLSEKEWGRGSSFSFLGLKFESIKEFSNYYNIKPEIARNLLHKYEIARIEELFLWLDSAEKESGITISPDFKWGYLLKISSRLNKKDIVYQIKNLDKLDSDCNYYFGGKSFKRLIDVYAEYGIDSHSYGYKMFLKEKVPLYVIIDIVVGTNIPELSYKSPNTYLYFYYRSTIHSRDIESELDDIRDHFKKGYTANEILSTRKICDFLVKSAGVSSKSFIYFKLGKIISKERLTRYFNLSYEDAYTTPRLTGIKRRFMMYSDVEIIKASHRVGDIQYFLCKDGSELKYLSGTELVDIAIESVKDREEVKIK